MSIVWAPKDRNEASNLAFSLRSLQDKGCKFLAAAKGDHFFFRIAPQGRDAETFRFDSAAKRDAVRKYAEELKKASDPVRAAPPLDVPLRTAGGPQREPPPPRPRAPRPRRPRRTRPRRGRRSSRSAPT